MSMWIEKKSATTPGRVEIITVPLVEFLMPLAMMIAVVAASGSGGAILFATLGFFLFLFAKLSLITRGVYVSWGSRKMSPCFRTCYRLGYGIMLLGAVAAMGALALRF